MDASLTPANLVRHRWWKRLQLIAGIVVFLEILFAFTFCVFCTDLLRLAPGTPIRPMGVVAMLVVSGLSATFIALTLIAIALILEWRKPKAWLLAALMTLLAIMPLPANIGIFRAIVAYQHLVLED